MSKFYITYLRLSKKQKAKDGQEEPEYYGIEAQRSTIDQELKRVDGIVLREYIEIEGGTRKSLRNRVEIFKALAHAKQTGATIIVAKLDRLARDTAFILEIINSGVEVLFCDFKFEGIAGKMLLTIISAFAEYEAARISERTKAGLAVAKARGVKIGGFTKEIRAAGVKASAQSRRDNYHKTANVTLRGRIEVMKNRDKMSLPEICRILNEEGLRSTRNKKFSPRMICDILRPSDERNVPKLLTEAGVKIA